MKIKWEKNSRVAALLSRGKIKKEDIIPRTTTNLFPPETVTVRMSKPQAKIPFITAHIKGRRKNNTNPHGYSYDYAHVLRVNFGGSYDKGLCPTGFLDEDYTLQDVHNVVEEIKEIMEI